MIYRSYIVAFLDLCGMRSRLLRFREVPPWHADSDEIVRQIAEAVSPILRLREIMGQYVAGSEEETEVTQGLPPDKAALIREKRKHNLRCSWFSDSIIMSIPVTNDNDGLMTLNALYLMFHIVAALSVASIGYGVPIRGGVELGPCYETDDKELFGVAIVEAYELESKVAKLPRVLAGSTLLDFLTQTASQRATSADMAVATDIAKRCLAFIEVDEGLSVINICADSAREIFRDYGNNELGESLYDVAARAVDDVLRAAGLAPEIVRKYEYLRYVLAQRSLKNGSLF